MFCSFKQTANTFEAHSISMDITVVALISCAVLGRRVAVRPGKKRSTIMVSARTFSAGSLTSTALPKAITER